MKARRLVCCLAIVLTLVLMLCACDMRPGDEYSAQEIFSIFGESVVHIETSGGGGTGFFIEENVIATNNHVIDGAQWITIKKTDGSVYNVSAVIARSENPDLALLEVDCEGTVLQRNTHGISEGEPVYAIGAPMGIFPCIADGIVMKSFHNDNEVDYFLSNFHAIGGNSGGPVLNAYGELMGVVVGGVSDGPNSIDMVIIADYIDGLERGEPVAVMTKEEYIAQMNAPEEDKYELSDPANAQTGQIVSFGSYEQDNDLANGTEEIFWLVTERSDDKLTLVSLYCLDAAPYSLEPGEVTWETSHVRAFLNGEFLESAFSEQERAAMLDTSITNSPNPVHNIDGGADTVDKVWLLSLEEVMSMYDIADAQETFYSQLYAPATPYAISKGLWLEIPDSNRCWWWLRSSGGNPENVAEVGSAGYLSFNGSPAINPERALRPVIRISVN